MAVTTETLRERESEETRKKLEDLLAQRAEVDQQIEHAQLLLQAWQNFDDTLKGKFARPTRQASKPKATGPRAPRGTLPPLQGKIAAIVGRYDGGAKAESINQELGARDDAAKKQIAAALTRMKSRGILNQTAPRQPYTLGPDAPRAAATTPSDEEAA